MFYVKSFSARMLTSLLNEMLRAADNLVR